MFLYLKNERRKWNTHNTEKTIAFASLQSNKNTCKCTIFLNVQPHTLKEFLDEWWKETEDRHKLLFNVIQKSLLERDGNYHSQ